MDNRGTPAPSNSRIRSLSNRRVTQNVEAPESSARRNTEADNVVDENEVILTSSGSETNSGNDAAYEAERRRKGKAVAHESSSDKEVDMPSGSETDSEDDPGAEFEYDRQLDVGIVEQSPINTNIVGVTLDTHALWCIAGLSKEFNVLKEGGIRSESEAAEGNVGNIGIHSTSNPVVELANISHRQNQHSVDEGAQTEALDAVRGKFIDDSGRTISDTEHIDSMPRPRVSSRGRLLKPTPKLLQLENATEPTSERKQPKRRRLNAINAREISMLNVSGVGGEVGVYEPSGSGSVVGQDGRANGVARQADVVNPDGSGVGGSGPTEPTSAAGQASGVNAVGRQTDMVVPFLECVINRNPMDLTIEEAKKFMRTE